jgi:hypothetical protein
MEDIEKSKVSLSNQRTTIEIYQTLVNADFEHQKVE